MLGIFACLMLFFGCVNISQEQGGQEQTQTEKQPTQKPPKPPPVTRPGIVDSEPAGNGGAVKPPVNVGEASGSEENDSG